MPIRWYRIACLSSDPPDGFVKPFARNLFRHCKDINLTKDVLSSRRLPEPQCDEDVSEFLAECARSDRTDRLEATLDVSGLPRVRFDSSVAGLNHAANVSADRRSETSEGRVRIDVIWESLDWPWAPAHHFGLREFCSRLLVDESASSTENELPFAHVAAYQGDDVGVEWESPVIPTLVAHRSWADFKHDLLQLCLSDHTRTWQPAYWDRIGNQPPTKENCLRALQDAPRLKEYHASEASNRCLELYAARVDPDAVVGTPDKRLQLGLEAALLSLNKGWREPSLYFPTCTHLFRFGRRGGVGICVDQVNGPSLAQLYMKLAEVLWLNPQWQETIDSIMAFDDIRQVMTSRLFESQFLNEGES